MARMSYPDQQFIESRLAPCLQISRHMHACRACVSSPLQINFTVTKGEVTANGRTLASLEASFGKMPFDEGMVRIAVKRSQRELRASKQIASSALESTAVCLPWAASDFLVGQMRRGSLEGLLEGPADHQSTLDELFAKILRQLADGDFEGVRQSLVCLKSALDIATGRQARSRGGGVQSPESKARFLVAAR